MARIDAIRQISVVEQTYYRWRKQYGGMGTAQLKELKRLQKENERLRRAVSDLTLDKLILSEASRGMKTPQCVPWVLTSDSIDKPSKPFELSVPLKPETCLSFVQANFGLMSLRTAQATGTQ